MLVGSLWGAMRLFGSCQVDPVTSRESEDVVEATVSFRPQRLAFCKVFGLLISLWAASVGLCFCFNPFFFCSFY